MVLDIKVINNDATCLTVPKKLDANDLPFSAFQLWTYLSRLCNQIIVHRTLRNKISANKSKLVHCLSTSNLNVR